MNTVNFDEYNSYNDFSLFLSEKTIEIPEPKTEYIEIPGSDGKLDFSDFFGEIKYNDRKIHLILKTVNINIDKITDIQNKLHFKKMKISFSDDPNFYYFGRVKIKSVFNEKEIVVFNIEIDANPYKYKKDLTIINENIVNSKVVICQNLKKSVVPEITTNATFSIEFNSKTIVQNAGTFLIPEILLVEGNNEIKFIGNGNVIIKYREACI